ncbi:MAG: hypothetical protein ACLFOC_02955 [Campylobacterales bacterium]
MAEQFGLKFKKQIEELKELPNFEAKGDEIFFSHPDPEARMTWAFYRPSGSHPLQIEDSDPLVSAMAFNHSRLRPLERLGKLHPDVLKEPKLRVRIAKRARMLFRALADEDFIELVEAMKLYPVYIDLACDQVINGRKMLEEVRADIFAASEFLGIVENRADKKLVDAVMAKLPSVKEMESRELKSYIEYLVENRDRIHKSILKRYSEDIEDMLENTLELHILQKKAFEALLKGLFHE